MCMVSNQDGRQGMAVVGSVLKIETFEKLEDGRMLIVSRGAEVGTGGTAVLFAVSTSARGFAPASRSQRASPATPASPSPASGPLTG